MIKSAFSWMIDRHGEATWIQSKRLMAFDLLPWLAASWMASAIGRQGDSRRQLLSRARFLLELSSQGVVLLLNLPIRHGERLRKWIGNRLFFCPSGIPTGQVAAISSSRLERPWDHQDRWFQALRHTCRLSARRHQPVLTVTGTTTARFLLSCPQSLGVQSWQFDFPRRQEHLGTWLIERTTGCLDDHSPSSWRSWVSPPLQAECSSSSLASYSPGDRLLIAAADSLHLLMIRPRGNIAELVQRRFSRGPAATRMSGIHVTTTSRLPTPPRQLPCSFLAPGIPSSAPVYSVDEIPAHLDEQFLAHWTRRCDGPWPGQTGPAWFEELLMADPSRQRSAECVLERIILHQQILASPAAIRQATPVVCLTAIPVDQWPEMRVYRPHRRRWDFLPFAIAMRLDWLLEKGARQVIYGEEHDWQSLLPAWRPFFQKSRSLQGISEIDWRLEQEWRVVGDIDLAELDSEDGFVLAPDLRTARRLAPLCRWPVYFESSHPAH